MGLAGGGTARPADDLLAALGFPDSPELGYYGNERPARPEATLGGPAIGAAEPAGWFEFPVVMYQVALDDLQGTATAPVLASICDVVTRAWGVPLTAPQPGVSLDQQAAHWFSLERLLDWLNAAANAGLKGIGPIPISAWTDTDPGFTFESPGGVSQGVKFEIPWGKPAPKTAVFPAMAVWLEQFLPTVLAAVEADPVASSALIGFWGPEELAPNPIGLWGQYYLALRLRRAIDALTPGRLLMTYMQNSSNPATGLANQAASIGLAPPLDPAQPTAIAAIRMGGLPAGFPGGPLGYGQDLLAEVGSGIQFERRWRIYDGRGFPQDIPFFNENNPATYPTDFDGNTTVFMDPDSDRWPVPVATADLEAPAPGFPFASGEAPDLETNNVVGAEIPDRYRPWQATASYYASWYSMPDGLGFAPPLMDHWVGGNYVDRALGWNATEAATNRIIGYHRMQGLLEGRLSATQMLAKARQQPGDCKVFNVVEVNIHTNDGQYIAPATQAFGRHDFWVGLHHGEAVLVYLWGERQYVDGFDAQGQPIYMQVPGWNGYVESLQLLKGTHPEWDVCIREFLVAGERIDVGFQFLGADPLPPLTSAPGLTSPPAYRGGTIGYVKDWELVNVSGFRLRDKVAVVVTSSYAQTVQFHLGTAGSLLNGVPDPQVLLQPSVQLFAGPGGQTGVEIDGIEGFVLLFTL